jgi:hypothetical protein
MKPTLSLRLLPPIAVLVAAATAGTALARTQVVRAASPIDGRWHASITRAGLVRTGEVDPAEAAKLYGPWTAQFVNGRFQARNERTGLGAKGTFSVAGKVVRFVFATGVGVEPGAVAFCPASVYRDRLTFTRTRGRPCLAWNAAVWTRVS